MYWVVMVSPMDNKSIAIIDLMENDEQDDLFVEMNFPLIFKVYNDDTRKWDIMKLNNDVEARDLMKIYEKSPWLPLGQ